MVGTMDVSWSSDGLVSRNMGSSRKGMVEKMMALAIRSLSIYGIYRSILECFHFEHIEAIENTFRFPHLSRFSNHQLLFQPPLGRFATTKE